VNLQERSTRYGMLRMKQEDSTQQRLSREEKLERDDAKVEKRKQTCTLQATVQTLNAGERWFARYRSGNSATNAVQWRWDSLKKKEALQSICEVQRGEGYKQVNKHGVFQR